MSKEWRVNPREPFNCSVWSDIASSLFTEQLKTGRAVLRIADDGRTVRLFCVRPDSAESDATPAPVE